ncbi:hypothetical protein ABB37_06312 [Leptomonas pyrrhocoris]|uniref:Uncharacterized protein n=1 Tax=Leptomonas pyrrhocoris TaxID=157538 RepID=A0A0N0VEF0_LEPPY|nr:hypothetical protein ABB37_06312 [Leptomonas pyrrhocoris]KPA78128.1 hypothetical protein ABB37_06312 [Leptomonas pyrrhocoris]|eukprot:XP_015656567.1 hypothetical protein ABB37_06312 [Leptomonas pyrrhocoris]
MPREVIIGTSDAGEDPADPSQVLAQEMPALSVVEAHMQRLRYDLCGDRHASSGYAARVSIPASDLTRIASLVDLLDQLRNWSIEEGTTFVEEPSRLAETEAPEAVVACVCSGRPRLMTQALSVVQPMLRHPQTAWELRRVVCEVQRSRTQHANSTSKKAREEEKEEGNAAELNLEAEDGTRGDPLLILLADIVAHHAGAAPLLAEALSTAAAVVQVVLHDLSQGETEEVVFQRVRSIADALYATPLVFHIELAMRRFAAVAPLQVNGVHFFAALVDLPALTDDGPARVPSSGAAADDSGSAHAVDATRAREEREKSMGPGEELPEESVSPPSSLADVVAHSDGVLDVLQRAMQLHRHLLSLRRGVLHVWCVCAQRPPCRVSLLRHGVYGAALRQVSEVGPYTMDVFREAAEIVGYFTPLLDVLQRRSLLLTLHGILQRRPQLEMIEVVLALLVAVLTVVSRPSSTGDAPHDRTHRHPHGDVRGDAGRGRRGGNSDPYAMYATCVQPPTLPTTSPSRVPATVAETEAPRQRCLRLSPLFWQPSSSSSTSSISSTTSRAADGDTWQFMLQRCALPQLVSGLHGYFSACEVVDEQDAAAVERVCALAEAVLTFF